MSYSSEVLADSPVLYLQLNETSGATCANSGSLGGNATATGTFTRNVTAPHANLGVAVDLAGTTSDYISYPDNASLDITGDVTYECWVACDTFTSSPIVMSKGSDDASNGGYAFIILSTRAIRIQRAHIGNLYQSSAGVFPNDTSWHHLVFTRIGSNFVVYIDGASAASGSSATAVQATSRAFYMGVSYNHTTGIVQPLDGKLDEVAVYNTGLSSGRIAAHYAAYNAAAAPTFVPQVMIHA